MNNAKALAEALKTLHLPDETHQVCDDLINRIVTAYVLYGDDSAATKDSIVRIFEDGKAIYVIVAVIVLCSPDLLINSGELLKKSQSETVNVVDFMDYVRPVYSDEE